jgi:hypothetical protein
MFSAVGCYTRGPVKTVLEVSVRSVYSLTIWMTALAVFQTSAFAGGAELAAIVLSAFGYACAGLNFAITIRMGTRFFSHD